MAHYAHMQKLTFYFRVVLGACLLLSAGVLCALYLDMALRGTGHGAAIGYRLQCVFAFLLFAFIAFAVWRILLFRRDGPLNSSAPTGGSGAAPPDAGSPVPVTPFDVTRRYDIYCSLIGEQRIYENVRLAGIRTFDKITQFSSGALGGLLEIETANGTRMLIPQHGIEMICEHGAQPSYKVVEPCSPPDEGNSWRKDSGE